MSELGGGNVKTATHLNKLCYTRAADTETAEIQVRGYMHGSKFL